MTLKVIGTGFGRTGTGCSVSKNYNCSCTI